MDAATEITPEKAWQAAIANLQMDMSRAAFETWVKPTHLEDFKDNTFVIGCMNTYGRDWLADRLTSTLERFLSGVMNQDIKVRFMVCDPVCDLDNPDDEDDLEPIRIPKPTQLNWIFYMAPFGIISLNPDVWFDCQSITCAGFRMSRPKLFFW